METQKKQIFNSDKFKLTVNNLVNDLNGFFYNADKESPNTYEDIDTTIKYILANKIKKEHLINYLKHSYKIYK